MSMASFHEMQAPLLTNVTTGTTLPGTGTVSYRVAKPVSYQYTLLVLVVTWAHHLLTYTYTEYEYEVQSAGSLSMFTCCLWRQYRVPSYNWYNCTRTIWTAKYTAPFQSNAPTVEVERITSAAAPTHTLLYIIKIIMLKILHFRK